MSEYTATLRGGQEIYIPTWPVDVAIENLTRAGQYIGTSHIINIAELKMPSVILAIMDSKEPDQTASLIKHFVCQVRIDGKKIEPNSLDEMFAGELGLIAELFAHTIKAQYSSFFDYGLAKEASPSS